MPPPFPPPGNGRAANVLFRFLLAGYLWFSLCVYLISRKRNVSGAWMAWVPILQIAPFLESADKPLWWALFLFIPLVNGVVWIYLWMCIAENLGYSKWRGLLMLVPVVNVVFPIVLAVSGVTGSRGMEEATEEIPAA